MTKKLLITRPDYETTTNYLFKWSEKLITEANDMGIIVDDLKSNFANRKEFDKKIKNNHGFVYLNGHGSPNIVTGQNGETLLKFADNESCVKDKIVYAMSCSSAKRLGKSCVASGGLSYLGYDEDFIFIIDEEKINNPKEDTLASYFLSPSNHLVEHLISGKTTGEAFGVSQSVFNDCIKTLSSSEASPADRDLLPYLVWDRDHQVCLGKNDAVFKETKDNFQLINILPYLLGFLFIIGLALWFIIK